MAKLEPKIVFDQFAQINKIPRPSKHEEKMIEYLKDFGKSHGLETVVDETGNVLIKKPATKGYEDRPTVVLQSHMDMVCDKLVDVDFDFYNDPIQTYVDGDWLRAKGTTLGADDGIGDAIELAILASDDIEHGPIECVFTRDEETELSGAIGMKSDFMSGKYLINLDSEDDGIITIGCAGGLESLVYFDYTPEAAPADLVYFKLNITKMHGGHSGSDIDKGYACATKQIARLLYRLEQKFDFRLARVDAGNLHNAIAREAVAIVGVKPDDKEKLSVELNAYIADVKNEYKATEPHMEVLCESVEKPATVIDADTARRIISAAYVAQHGIYSMDHDIKELVETSTNFASIKTLEAEKTIYIEHFSRSSVESRKYELAGQIEALYKLAGARKVDYTGGYQGWQPNVNSKLLADAVAQWEKLYGVKPIVNAIHAGLECGLFLQQAPHMEMISYGPTLENVHSPQERCHIPAVQKAWDFTVALLQAIACEK